ncbi:AI-2E family transporter [Agrococcus sp. SGAir0287]|uniref:AI-2E family transporter n=1 Tax=Agrococcus sp. SGAir0287 TaxID=2070347 RepID=UPI0020C7DE25|nr:AI-2E family transporter [Agrococcus sp. SGAir0287]
MRLFGGRDRGDAPTRPAAGGVPSGADTVPPGLRIASAWSWRLLVVGLALAALLFLVAQLRIIVIPLMVAALLTALMIPLVEWLQRHRWPRGLAVAVAVVLLLAAVTALFWLAVSQIRGGYPDLQRRALASYDGLRQLLLESPLHLTERDISRYTGAVVDAIQQDSQQILSGALSVGSSLGHLLVGMLLTIFATIFLLYDGARIWRWIVHIFPRRARQAVDGSGRAGWVTLGNFVRVQVLVAAIDAVGIGLGAFILGLFYGGFPLVVPIAVLVFLGSFIPVVGAVTTGAIAVLVALIALGPIPAVIMLGIVLLVQQIEGHVLQPFIMGSAVKVHPLAVVLAVAGGSIVAGIPGALFAVPVVAFLNVAITTIATGAWRTNPRPRDVSEVPTA